MFLKVILMNLNKVKYIYTLPYKLQVREEFFTTLLQHGFIQNVI